MSNSFPSMISNEPPPLDQSDEEDEDSEEFRDFSSGLKLDIDPSPMSTPRKSDVGNVSPPTTVLTQVQVTTETTETVSNGASSPELGSKVSEEEDDDFDNFQDFESAPSLPKPLVSVPSLPSTTTTTSNINLVNNVTAVIPPTHSSSKCLNVDEIPSSSLSFVSKPTPPLLESKFESIVKSLFVITPDISNSNSELSSSLKPIDKELKEDNDNAEWNRVEDFEGSQGLVFKWLNSVAYEKLLHSLKIDKSSIVYSNKWGAIEVPRFAASLVDSPLLPESTGSVTGSFKSGDFVSPSAKNVRTDISSSENDCGQGCTQLSQEAEEILSQLPDLAFMRAKTLVFPNNVLDAQTVTRTRDII